jgi:8-oxo-dGTP diphosphatase
MPSDTTIISGKKDIRTILKQLENDGIIGISVDCVIFGFDENELKVLLIKSDMKKFESKWTLLGDLVNNHEDLDEAAYRVLKTRTGMDDVYLEQVRAFGEVNRHPAARVVTIAYCSLINIQHHKLKILDNELHWHKLNSLS